MLVYEVIDTAGNPFKLFDSAAQAAGFAAENDCVIKQRELLPFEELTLADALEIIEKLENEISLSAIARALNVSNITLNNWKKTKRGRLKGSQMIALCELSRLYL